jgi:hypothetical protein
MARQIHATQQLTTSHSTLLPTVPHTQDHNAITFYGIDNPVRKAAKDALTRTLNPACPAEQRKGHQAIRGLEDRIVFHRIGDLLAIIEVWSTEARRMRSSVYRCA